MAEGDRRPRRSRAPARARRAHLHARHRRALRRRPTPRGAKVEERYGITVEAYRGDWIPGLWSTDPDRCCFLRKVEPLERALEDADCWISGVRRDQSPDRARTEELDWDERHGLWKANPLATWSERDVWAYIAAHDLPYNPLHDQGYASIGCTHCTLPGAGRDGRWAGLEKSECGLHAPASR